MKVAVAMCLALLAAVLVQAEEEMAPPVLPAGTRIVNGIPATPQLLPYMAYIEAFRGDGSLQWQCAGSLISRAAVLTVHWYCTYDPAKKWTVRLGDINREGEVVNTWTVESVMAVSHPKSNSNYDNNIAIIQLPMLVPVYEFIQPVHLPSSPDVSSYVGCQGIVAGWGYTAPSSGPSDVLRWAEVLVVNNDFCRELNPSYIAVTERQLCAGSSSATVYWYDWGAPLVLNISGKYTQIGIFSLYTTEELNTSHPAIFTRVTSYLDWIKLYTDSD